MAASWIQWRRRNVVRGRFNETTVWNWFREEVTGPLPPTTPHYVELVPKDPLPTLSSIFVETLCRSSVENGLFRQSFRQRPDYSLWDKLYVVTRSLERKQAIQQFNKRAVISGYLLPGPLEDYHGSFLRIESTNAEEVVTFRIP